MNSSEDRWEQIAAELRAYRKAQSEVWGDLDDIMLAGYIAGVLDEDEAKQIEELMTEKPEVGRLISLVKELTAPDGLATATLTETTPLTATAAATVSHPGKGSGRWEFVGSKVHVLRDALCAWVDEASNVVATGIGVLMGEPDISLESGPAAVPMDGTRSNSSEPTWEQEPEAKRVPTADKCSWKIPVEEQAYEVMIRARPTARATWEISLDIGSDEKPDIAEMARCSLIAQGDDIPFRQGSVAERFGKDRFFEINSGRWELRITLYQNVHVLPLDLSSPPPAQ